MLFVTNLHFKFNGNGGQQRTYFLIKELATHFDLIVLSPYNEDQDAVQGIDATFIVNNGVKARKMMQTSIPGRIISKIADLVFSFTKTSKTSIINIASRQLRKQIKNIKEQKRFDHVQTIVFDTISTVVKFENKLFQKRILNAHNFDFEISEYKFLQQLKDTSTPTSRLENTLNDIISTRNLEFDIDTYFDEIWTCSAADVVKFKTYNPNTKVIFHVLPNGSDTDERTFQAINGNYKKMLFVGSLNYFPNINGLKWFIDSIFKNLPKDFELTIVGKSPDEILYDLVKSYSNIQLVGEVDDVEGYYQSHDVFIVPIMEGSGTRLKILEAFSYGKLVLSTQKGIEGIEAIDKEHYIAFNDLKEFECGFLKSMDVDRFKTIRENARALVEHDYSWKNSVSRYIKTYGA